ncbi:MAG TPA: hypothetical protein DD723_01225 [Candidatus Omnitrophica bacterium]|nr:MAG: hypothetical protein A2Z81_02200 [Omnitrophica WOR_2 bacterium GWA2_45_18]HBR14152.1 hypothetical protein [Candidatus Omnitrophota bacterium]
MAQHLQEIKLKQKKLIFLFGEIMYHFYKSQDVRFLGTSEGEAKEKEVEKLVRLLDYLQERIQKFEEIYDDEHPVGESEVEEEEKRPVEEETSQGEEPPKVEDPEEPIETEDSEVVEEESDKEASRCEKVLEPEKEEQKNFVSPGAVQNVVEESLPSAENAAAATEECVSAEVAVKRAVAEESVRSVPLAREGFGDEDILENIFQTAIFASDAEKKLFKKNLEHLKKGNEREREICVSQIAHVTGKEALRKVYEFAMKDVSSRVRLAVIKNISRMKEGESKDFLELGLSDPDAKVRIAAIKSLGRHGSDKYRKILERFLKDSDQHIRGLAVTYLGIYHGEEGIRKAIMAWTDESPYVRISLIEMLSVVKPEGALTTIKNLLSDREEEVKKAAEKALKKLIPGRKGVAA